MFDDCKFSKMPVIAQLIIVSFFLIGGVIGYFCGEIIYNYSLDKCENLKESPYNFDFKIENNAQYASSCYYYNNHPFAEPLNVFGYMFIGIMFGIIPMMLIWEHYDIKEFKKNLKRKYG